MAYSLQIFASGLPEKCGLFKVKQAVQKALKDEDAVQSINYVKDRNNDRMSSCVELHLTSDNRKWHRLILYFISAVSP